ncbi:LPXTG cell wall anchor domain-containing protein [Streptomyces sp. NPDC001774]
MTKKTRIRVARIAAGAIIAAGASLTAAGAASAVGVDLTIGVQAELPEVDPTCIPGTPGCEETPPTTPPVTTPPVTTPPVTTPPVTTPPVTTPPVTTPPVTTPPVTTPPTTPTTPGETPSPTTPSDDSTDDAGTCTVDLDGAECVNNPDTDNAGSQPVEQGKAKEELAETGAAETSFLIIGAATMIAGGIGFRMLPRLVGGGRAAV